MMRIKLVSRKSFPRAYQYQEKIYNIMWTFNKTDADFRPSVPHGHSQDHRYKLRLWDGTVYKVQGSKLIYEGYAKQKEMKKLYNDPKFQSFVGSARKFYKENFPHCPKLVPLQGSAMAMHISTKLSRYPVCDTYTVKLPVKLYKKGGD